ncbi:MAG: PAS domain S-box protein [Desulfobacteraceae bacterium]|nr:PAS domain S-box protein [Desulfobacteraceae bacterium]
MVEKPTYDDLKQRISTLEKKLKASHTQNSDEKYRILFEKSKDAILIIENSQFIDCNQATVEMLGYKNKTEFLKTHPAELSPDLQQDGEDSYTKAKAMIDLALKNGSHKFEWNHLRADGEIIPIEVHLTTISNQKDHQVIHTIWRDITNRRKAETALQKEKEILSIILESAPQGIALIDHQGKYLYVNPHFTKITGYTLQDIPTKEDWFKKVYPDKEYRKHVIETWSDDSDHQGTGKIREFKIQCKNGESKYIEFKSTFLKDQKISLVTDVTDRKQSEKTLREKDRLQGVLELSGTVCHEMNQPLMSIMGYFDLIQMDIQEDNPLYCTIQKIHAQIDRLSDLGKKLAEISRYETKSYLKEQIVDLTKASTTSNL